MMEIRTNENGHLYPYYSEYEMSLIREFGFTDYENKSDDAVPVAELVAMALHYDRGALIDGRVLYPVFNPVDDSEDPHMELDWVEAWMAPWPSNAARLVGQLVEIAYAHIDQRSAAKEKLHRLGESFERINEKREAGWPLPTLEKIGKIWWALIEAEEGHEDFTCVLMTQKEYDELVSA